MADVCLDKLIAPPFYGPWRRIRDGRERIDELWMDGGRGSCKSTFASIMIICGLLDDPEANAIVYRKVANTLRESVFAQLWWAVEQLGLTDRFQRKYSPMAIECPQTGQRVLFCGADKPEKSKGLKLAHGYFRYLWFEELTEFNGMADVGTIVASIFRGSNKRGLTIYSYNPPMSKRDWVNIEAKKHREHRLRHHSDYRGVPTEWLGARFLAEAEAKRLQNETQYRHIYLGEETGTGGEVFENVIVRDVSPDEWNGLPTYCGLDFGFAGDPDCFVRCAYDKKRGVLYMVSEFASTGLLLDTLAEEVRKRSGRDVVTCDSADPRSIATLRAKGLRVIAARKGPDSIDHGVKWLQTRTRIVIDRRCKLAADEFPLYEYDRDKEGNPIPRYPDKNNHTIDAARYAMESVSGQRVAVVPK